MTISSCDTDCWASGKHALLQGFNGPLVRFYRQYKSALHRTGEVFFQ